ncbi:hypothetical protein K439DRAFT_819123 [Ramaria rubella]|nr:hypothetical protein K439DRAFT_819123 [Ramaria rubella]
MCLVVISGSTKYLNCGHISGAQAETYDCGSTQCKHSQNHPWLCHRGAIRGCPGCSSTHACSHHHTCSGPETRESYDNTRPGFCRQCRS